MKTIVLVLSSMVLGACASGQGDLQTYIQQIAANKIYIEYLGKGYQIARTGLKAISDIKAGHFQLDRIFFDGLPSVNPSIKRFTKVAATGVMLLQATKAAKDGMARSRGAAVFSAGDLGYFEKVYGRLMDDVTALLDELDWVLADGTLKMSDDERIKRIDKVYEETRSSLAFVQSFNARLNVFVLQGNRAARENNLLKGMYRHRGE